MHIVTSIFFQPTLMLMHEVSQSMVRINLHFQALTWTVLSPLFPENCSTDCNCVSNLLVFSTNDWWLSWNCFLSWTFSCRAKRSSSCASSETKNYHKLFFLALVKRKCCLLFSNISLYSRDIQVFKICKSATRWCHTLNRILIKHNQLRYLSQLICMKLFDSLKILTEVRQYELSIFITVATYWVPNPLIIEAFLATFSIPYSHLPMVPHLQDPTTI